MRRWGDPRMGRGVPPFNVNDYLTPNPMRSPLIDGSGGLGAMGAMGMRPGGLGLGLGRRQLMLAGMDGMCGIGGIRVMPPVMGMGMIPGLGMGMGLGAPPEVMAAHAKGLADIEAKKEELKKKQLQAQIDKVNEVHERALAVLDAQMPKVRGGK